MTIAPPTEREQADYFVGLVRDVLTLDELVQLSQRAYVTQREGLRSELHHWIGVRYADGRARQVVGLIGST